jgi:hypothetical protein
MASLQNTFVLCDINVVGRTLKTDYKKRNGLAKINGEDTMSY